MRRFQVFGIPLVLLAVFARAESGAPFPVWSEPRAVTQGPHEHFLASYFAIDSWSPNKRYVLVLETDVNGRLPEANERCTLGVVDLEDGNRFIPVTTTACWNFQEAAMAFWMDDGTILFNDVRDGRFKAVVMDWRTGKDVRVLPRPVSAVSEDRTWAVSVNYARLSLLRPDYGYAGPGQDPQETVEWPENDGLWTMDLKTGESKLILSVADTRSQMPQPKRVEGKPGQPLAYHCHTVISKDGEKIFFLARSVDWFDRVTHEIPYWRTTSFTVDRDGGNLRRCFKDNWEGSHFNWAPDGSHRMLVTATCKDTYDPDVTGRAWSLVEFEVGKETDVRRIGAGILDLDWHCVYSPDGKFMSGETYWDKYNERPWVLVRLEDGATMPMGSFHVPEKYRGTYWRCDLHARYRPDGRQIAFNSVHEGSRQVYVRDIRLPGEPTEGTGSALRPTAFRLLKPGSVRAERWLLRQLELQREGLTGHAEELFDDIGKSDWLTGESRGGQSAWERGPYYLKGLVSLAFALDDDALKAKAQRWIESILKSQRPNGDFGPRADNWWANMIVLHLMRDYYEVTEDARALAFLERYFTYQREALVRKPLGAESIWADQRGGDELEVVLWLCGRPGGGKWLDFARLVASQTRQARDNGRSVNGTGHIVNFMQSLKAPALKWRLGGEGKATDAYWRAFGPEGREFLAYGRPDRMLNGSETLSDNRTSEGTELCAIVERILSNRTILEVSGEARIADDLESVAYNALPGTVLPDMRGTRYYNILNQPVCDDRCNRKMQANGPGGATCPGPEAGFGCCRSNWHFGWPKFVSSLWMAADEGLAAVAYGPCRVTAPVADGVAEIREETDYPFRETVSFTVSSCTATRAFGLRLRIPAWCDGAKLSVNGRPEAAGAAGSFVTLTRTWKAGDRVELVLPMRIRLENGWNRNATAVFRGPLLFAHAIPYMTEEIGKSDGPRKSFPKLRLLPKEGESWAKALVTRDLRARWKVSELPVAVQPFDPATPAVTITADAVPCTALGWGTMVSDPGDTGRAVEPPWSGGSQPKELVEPLQLQPVGATQLRITIFPVAKVK